MTNFFTDDKGLRAMELYTKPRLKISEDGLEPEMARGGKLTRKRQLCHLITEEEKKAAG